MNRLVRSGTLASAANITLRLGRSLLSLSRALAGLLLWLFKSPAELALHVESGGLREKCATWTDNNSSIARTIHQAQYWREFWMAQFAS
jgi:hypothetical protein